MRTLLRHSLPACLSKKVNQKPNLSRASLFSLFICVLFLQQSVTAQNYHTYHSADSANPILNATPKPQGIIDMQFFDVDGDGDLDCYLMLSGNKLVLYLNVGTAKRPEYQLADYTGLEDITPVAARYGQHFYFFDMDNDGDKDLFLEAYYVDAHHSTANYSYIQSYLNDGTAQKPHFIMATFNPVDFARYVEAFNFFTFQDIDGDGDMDFAYNASKSPGFITQVYLNTSTSGNASFVQQPYGSEQINYEYQSFYDFSGDGLPDCLLINNGVNYGQYFPNIGTATSPQVNIFGPHGPYPSPDFGPVGPVSIVDLNNDGQVEIFNRAGAYGTVTPVPVLQASAANVGGKPVTKLTATTQLPGYKYQWEYNGKKVTGYNKPFIYAPAKGKYVLYITDTLGTGVSLPYILSNKTDSANANREMIVSAKPAIQTLSVQVYPSPFRESVTIKIAGGSAATPKTIRISDMSGKIWLTQTTSASAIQAGASLPKGMYQLEVWENKTLSYHTKILKQ